MEGPRAVAAVRSMVVISAGAILVRPSPAGRTLPVVLRAVHCVLVSGSGGERWPVLGRVAGYRIC